MTDSTRWPQRREAVGERRAGPGRPGRAGRAPAARGTPRAGPRPGPGRARGRPARPAAAASAAAVVGADGGESQRAGGRPAAGADAAGAVGRRDDEPVERRPAGPARARSATPPSIGSPISISGTCTTVAPSATRRSPSSPASGRVMAMRLPASGRHPPTTRRASRAAVAGPLVVAGVERQRRCARGPRPVRRSAGEEHVQPCRRRRGRRRAASSPNRARRGSCARPRPRGASPASSTGGEQLGRRRVVGAGLDGDAALPDGRHEPARVEALGDPLGQPEHLQRGHGHHDRAAVGNLRQAGGDVAAQLDERRDRAAPLPAAPAVAPSRWRRSRPAASSASGRPISASAGIAPGGERADHQRLVRRRREVLGRVHGDVGAAVEHGLLDLLDEHALAADHVQRHVLAAVTGRVDEHELGLAPGRRRRARRRRPGPGCAPAGSRGWPGGGRGTRRSVQVEQVAHGRRVALALGRAGVVAEAHRRAVQQLGDDRPGQRLDGVALVVVEVGEAVGEAGDLPGRIGSAASCSSADERRGLAGRRPRARTARPPR